MSQPPFNQEPFVPPPPPPVFDSPFDPRVLAEKAEFINKNSIYALIFAVTGVLCCPIVLGVYGFMLANSVLENIEYYNICHNRKILAQIAKVLAGLGVVIWVAGFAIRVFISR